LCCWSTSKHREPARLPRALQRPSARVEFGHDDGMPRRVGCYGVGQLDAGRV
jgi:hypothetical protein